MAAAPIRFVWDHVKADLNLVKHGITFDFGTRVFLDPVHVDFDVSRPEDMEQRRKAVGQIEGDLFTVVHTIRFGARRLISARHANRQEEKLYGPGL
jgi:hypothetical protein